jgi:hypothetical protein
MIYEVGSSKCMALGVGGVMGQLGLNMKRVQFYVVINQIIWLFNLVMQKQKCVLHV